METLINLLEALLFIAKAGLAVSLIVLFAVLGEYALAEIKETLAERRIELAQNKADLDLLKKTDTTVFTEWVGKHRLETPAKKQSHTGQHRVIKGASSYSKLYAYVPPKKPIYNDDNFFAALIQERDETAPIF